MEGLGRRCGAKACEQHRMGLLGMQQEQPAILAKHSLVLTEPFGISALYFSVLQFLEDSVSLNRDALSWLRSSREKADEAVHAEKIGGKKI